MSPQGPTAFVPLNIINPDMKYPYPGSRYFLPRASCLSVRSHHLMKTGAQPWPRSRVWMTCRIRTGRDLDHSRNAGRADHCQQHQFHQPRQREAVSLPAHWTSRCGRPHGNCSADFALADIGTSTKSVWALARAPTAPGLPASGLPPTPAATWERASSSNWTPSSPCSLVPTCGRRPAAG